MRRGLWLGAGVAVAVIAAAAVGALQFRAAPAPTIPPAPMPAAHAPASPKPAPPASQAASAPAPSFDIVRVDPGGHAVIAGRAAPGDRVRVLADGVSLGHVTADARGEWVLIPKTPLMPGDRRLSLEATDPRTGAKRLSAGTVAVEVAPSAKPGTTVAVLVPNSGEKPVQVLQQPGSSPRTGRLSIDTAEYDGHGHVALAGHAAPGATVNLYAGKAALGTATADARGNWSLRAPLASGGKNVELRAEAAPANGAVAQSVTAPFAPPGAVSLPAGQRYTVKRGNNLWLLARHTYGNGVRYTIIYQANRAHIHNPDLIYPGQIFILPKS